MSEVSDAADAAECARLEAQLLTDAQRRILDPKNPPHWDLDPPQREECLTPVAYVLALGRYADRVADRTATRITKKTRRP